METHPLLQILDCPSCHQDRGLLPQRDGELDYLACPICSFWYPIRDEVVVLLVPERNPNGVRRPLGEAVPLSLERREPKHVDLKALVYGFYARMNEFGERFHIDRESVVVDVGCSTGSLASWLRPDQTYIGFDLFFESLRFAREGSGQFFVQADAQRLPIKSGSVSFFTSREVLEHLDDPAAGAAELRRIGRRGVIVVPTLDFPFLYDPLNWVLIRGGRRAKFGIYGYGHQNLRDIAGWRALLEQNGLAVTREVPIGTGLALGAMDVMWHSLYSWREFDNLPRRGAPISWARALAPLQRAMHRVDSRLFDGRTLSHGFEVLPAS